jgi:hypothetical protein
LFVITGFITIKDLVSVQGTRIPTCFISITIFYENDEGGVNLRRERAPNAPHRSTFRENMIENNGKYGFLVESPATDVLIENNTIRDTGSGFQEIGIYISQNGLPVMLKDNSFSGHQKGDVVNNAGK